MVKRHVYLQSPSTKQAARKLTTERQQPQEMP